MNITGLSSNLEINTASEQAFLRPPNQVMRLAHMGSYFPHRLSFMRVLIRNLAKQKARMQVAVCDLNKQGYGHVVLSMPVSGRVYSLIAYSRQLDDGERTDRVIATKWDASFCLFDGVPAAKDIEHLAEQVTRQEAGRYDQRVLTLSRANKSVRLFSHVVDQLANGCQPDIEKITAIGYLMRTTAVYGNGKFGIADRDKIAAFDGLDGAFQAEMLTVYLIREFTFLLADHCAKQKGGTKAARLSDANRRFLGIGNSTGLGMAPFLVTHPCLLNSWIMARETAIARIVGLGQVTDYQKHRCAELLLRVQKHCGEWQVDDEIQMQRIFQLRAEIAWLINDLTSNPLKKAQPFAELVSRVQDCSSEMQELVNSVLMELVPEQIDGLADCMSTPIEPRLVPEMQLAELKQIIATHYDWVDEIDFNSQKSDEKFWYVSAAKAEPRLGQRHEEPGAELEMPFNIPAYIQQLKHALKGCDDTQVTAAFLLKHPELRFIIRRVQTIAKHPYGEIRDNLVGSKCRPIDLLRCKLSFFGASKFDPKSDRWTRITLYQGAPSADELDRHRSDALDDWLFALQPVPQDDALPLAKTASSSQTTEFFA